MQTGLRWYLSYQSGYGHSLIEYDRQTQRVGVEITLEHFIFLSDVTAQFIFGFVVDETLPAALAVVEHWSNDFKSSNL